MGDFSVQKAAKVLRKWKVGNGDIILVKKSVVSEEGDLDKMRYALSRLGINALVLVVDEMDEVKVFDETAMNKLGWFRARPVTRLLKK